mmetsp:Transcript_36692/g.72141  ORF Transcript_36692/g.72141 Transcript_36692/m.72141 type:complete len:112 (+) Transcript_36692:136-471(+)
MSYYSSNSSSKNKQSARHASGRAPLKLKNIAEEPADRDLLQPIMENKLFDKFFCCGVKESDVCPDKDSLREKAQSMAAATTPDSDTGPSQEEIRAYAAFRKRAQQKRPGRF